MSDKRILFRLVCLVFILLTSNSYGQDKNIEGIVSDNSGIPLPGVTVIKKGTKIGTSTDFGGNFNLTANTGEIIVFSYVGFKTKEVEIGDSNTYNIFLEEENMSLDEIVVVGYGTQKKSDIISSVTSVKSEDYKQGTFNRYWRYVKRASRWCVHNNFRCGSWEFFQYTHSWKKFH